jgi:5-methylcytosine-specific restriction endonuclease McrA
MFTGPHLTLGAIALGVALLVAVLRRVGRGAGVQRDPQRDFTAAQRRHAFARAGGQCEQKHPLLPRCTAAPTHADHIYPWSKGGSTTLGNCQAMCRRHNLAKSSYVPAPVYIHRLENRRRRYFLDPSEVRVEYRIGVAPIGHY